VPKSSIWGSPWATQNRPSGDKGLQKSIQSAKFLRVLGSCRQKGGPGYQKGSPAHQNAQKCNMFARCFQQISNVFLSQFLMTRSTSVTKTNLVYPPISPVSQQKKTCFSPLLSISQIMDRKLPTKKAKLINGVGGMRRSL